MPSLRWWLIVVPLTLVLGAPVAVIVCLKTSNKVFRDLPKRDQLDLTLDDFHFRERDMLVRDKSGTWHRESRWVGQATFDELYGPSLLVAKAICVDEAAYKRAEVEHTIVTVHVGWPLRCISGSSEDGWNLNPNPTGFEERYAIDHYGTVIHPHIGRSGFYISPYRISNQGPGAVLVLADGDSRILGGEWLMVGHLNRVHPIQLIINCAVFGSWFFVLMLGVRVLRRWNRRRRGLCTKCKYQLVGLTTCPECGTELAGRAGTPAVAG